MKKHLIAVAVASAIAAPAMAQTVTLSGRLSMEVGAWGATGATAGSASDFRSRTRVADTASRITFAASEDLGGGLKAGIYCETGINVDNASNQGQAATTNANTSEFCSREGRGFIGNNLGEIRLGRQNVFWTQGALNPLGSTFLGHDNITNILVSGGSGVYTVRGENMIKLVAGAAAGALSNSEIYVGYMGPSGGAAVTTQTGESVGANAKANGRYQGFKVNYSDGPLFAMWDYQSSDNAFIAAGNRDREANKLGVGYRFGPTTLAVQAAQKSSKLVSTGVKTEETAYAVLVQHDLGAGTVLHAGYAAAGEQKTGGVTVANSGAKGYTLGVTRALSKRTHLYGAYHSLTNESAAAYNMAGGNYQSGTNAAGADPKAWGLGIIHNF